MTFYLNSVQQKFLLNGSFDSFMTLSASTGPGQLDVKRRHMSLLLKAGLVESQQRGTRTLYRMTDKAKTLHEVLTELEAISE